MIQHEDFYQCIARREVDIDEEEGTVVIKGKQFSIAEMLVVYYSADDKDKTYIITAPQGDDVFEMALAATRNHLDLWQVIDHFEWLEVKYYVLNNRGELRKHSDGVLPPPTVEERINGWHDCTIIENWINAIREQYTGELPNLEKILEIVRSDDYKVDPEELKKIDR